MGPRGVKILRTDLESEVEIEVDRKEYPIKKLVFWPKNYLPDIRELF